VISGVEHNNNNNNNTSAFNEFAHEQTEAG
jgi:hypothetical protein